MALSLQDVAIYIYKFDALHMTLFRKQPTHEYREQIREILLGAHNLGPKRLDFVLLVLKIKKNSMVVEFLKSVVRMWSTDIQYNLVINDISMTLLEEQLHLDIEKYKSNFILKMDIQNSKCNKDTFELTRIIQKNCIIEFEHSIRSLFEVYNYIHPIIAKRDYYNDCVTKYYGAVFDYNNINPIQFEPLWLNTYRHTVEFYYPSINSFGITTHAKFVYVNETPAVTDTVSFQLPIFGSSTVSLMQKISIVLSVFAVVDVETLSDLNNIYMFMLTLVGVATANSIYEKIMITNKKFNQKCEYICLRLLSYDISQYDGLLNNAIVCKSRMIPF